MIDISKLTESDKGRWVFYRAWNVKGKDAFGRIKSWNDHFVFVVYECDEDWSNYYHYTAKATSPDCLEFKEPEQESKMEKEKGHLERKKASLLFILTGLGRRKFYKLPFLKRHTFGACLPYIIWSYTCRALHIQTGSNKCYNSDDSFRCQCKWVIICGLKIGMCEEGKKRIKSRKEMGC